MIGMEDIAPHQPLKKDGREFRDVPSNPLVESTLPVSCVRCPLAALCPVEMDELGSMLGLPERLRAVGLVRRAGAGRIFFTSRRAPPGAMKCPACEHPLAEDALACPGCGLTRDALDAGCGVIPKLWKRASSPSPDLTLRELHALNRRIAWFERKFPQVYLSVVAARTPQSVSPFAYAFWLINRAAFGRPAPPSRSYVVRFVLDAARGSLSLTVGYGLEKILPEPDLQSALDAGKSALAAGRLGKGVDASIRKLRRLLRRNLRKIRSERSRP